MDNQTLNTEVGGNHYQQYIMQPIELIVACKWDFIQGNIAKYLLRAKYKNGKEDIAKAIHYCELGLELTYKKLPNEYPDNKTIIQTFIKINKIPSVFDVIFTAINATDYSVLKNFLTQNQFIEKYFL